MKSHLTVKIGRIGFNVHVECTVCPGEPEVRYYPDGSGYPGSPPSIDCIDHVECEECEWPNDNPDTWEYPEAWSYAARDERPDAFAIADRWIRAELETGAYDDELFANSEGDDYAY